MGVHHPPALITISKEGNTTMPSIEIICTEWPEGVTSWFVIVDGVQHGPFTTKAAAEGFADERRKGG